MKNKSVIKKIVCLVLTLTVAGHLIWLTSCRQNDTESAAFGKDGRELFALRAVNQTTFSETIIAHELGFFEEEGIKIDFIGALGSGITQFQAIANGDIDVFTQGHLTSVQDARTAGFKVKAVAPGFVDDPNNPHVVYLVRPDFPINSLADVKNYDGKVRFAVSSTGTALCTSGYLLKYFQDNNVSEDKYEIISMTGSSIPTAVLTGQGVDVTNSHTPESGQYLAQGMKSIGTSYDILQNPASGMAVRGFSEQFISEHPDVVQSFCNATYRARIFMETYPDAAKIAGAEYLGLDISQVSSNTYDQNKNIKTEYADIWQNLAEEVGFWEKGKYNIHETYTNEFVPKDYDPASDKDIADKLLSGEFYK